MSGCRFCDHPTVAGTDTCAYHRTPNRIVLVDEVGRIYDRTGVSIEVDDQDDGLTMKVFVQPLTDDERFKANADHLTALSQELGLP